MCWENGTAQLAPQRETHTLINIKPRALKSSAGNLKCEILIARLTPFSVARDGNFICVNLIAIYAGRTIIKCAHRNIYKQIYHFARSPPKVYNQSNKFAKGRVNFYQRREVNISLCWSN
jgi:hypothetical protein